MSQIHRQNDSACPMLWWARKLRNMDVARTCLQVSGLAEFEIPTQIQLLGQKKRKYFCSSTRTSLVIPPACFGRLWETYQETTGDKLHTFLGEKTARKEVKEHAQVLNRESSLSHMSKFYSEPESSGFFRCHHKEAASYVPGHRKQKHSALFVCHLKMQTYFDYCQ